MCCDDHAKITDSMGARPVTATGGKEVYKLCQESIKCDWICENQPNCHNRRNPVYCLTLYSYIQSLSRHTNYV